jgi:hypothetical protein
MMFLFEALWAAVAAALGYKTDAINRDNWRSARASARCG